MAITMVLAAIGAVVAVHLQQAAAAARGAAIHAGQAAVPGRLAGHDGDLPAAATRCANCHAASTPGPQPGAGAPYAAVLDAALLSSVRSRRGGPASRYDARALCTLLRTGLDPAQVMVSTAMPRYQPTDAQCEDLWTFLHSR